MRLPFPSSVNSNFVVLRELPKECEVVIHEELLEDDDDDEDEEEEVEE